MAERNAYAVLGIKKGATDQEIKVAFVELVKKYDPEVHTERYMVIQEAYNKLKDPKKRAKEDVLTFNTIDGHYLFSDEEKIKDEQKTSDDELNALRAAYRESAGDQKTREKLVLALMQYSYLYTRRQMWGDAITNWEEVQGIDPTNVRARNNLMFAYVTLGLSYALHSLYDEAVEIWEKALDLNPDNADLIHNLALASDKSNDHERSNKYWKEVTQLWKKALNQDNNDEYRKAVLIEAHRLNSERVEDPRRSSKNTPAENKAQSIDHYREVLSLKPDDFDAQFRIANSLIEEKRFSEAAKELAELSEKHPKNVEVLNMQGWALLNAGEIEQAFDVWNRCLAIDPKNTQAKENIVRAHLALGKQFRTKGMFTPALIHLKKLLRYTKSAEVFMEIGATYDMKGDKRSARQAYEQVLAFDKNHKQARKALTDLKMR
ncbi:MAG: tetratricopeptide repeat protein [Sumerlaeia bacterium]